MIHVCLEKKIAIKATQVHIKVKIMYFYLLLFFSKAIFWGEDWDPQKMLGTPIWSDMWVPGPRMKNPSAIPAPTVGPCCSLGRLLKKYVQIQHNKAETPNWQEATSWLFTSVAEDLNSGQSRTNPASGQSGIRTRNRRIASPTP